MITTVDTINTVTFSYVRLAPLPPPVMGTYKVKKSII